MATPSLNKPDGEAVVDVRVYFEPIVAWRAWRVDNEGRYGLQLRSITYPVHWPFRKPIRAHCMTQIKGNKVVHPHSGAPHVAHGCGIYSVKEREHLARWAVGKILLAEAGIVGQVSLWGDIVEFTQGYLAEYAYPKAFASMGPIAEELAYLYGVPLID